MRVKIWSGLLTVPLLMTLPVNGSAAEPKTYFMNSSLLPAHRARKVPLEVAGADETDRATEQQLKQSGTRMVPSEDLKKAEPLTQPSAEEKLEAPEKLMPEKPQPIAVEEMEPETKPVIEEPPEAEESPKRNKPVDTSFKMAGPYLRIDVGYGINNNPDGNQPSGAFSAETTDNGLVWGAGIGYRFNENFRSDLTFSHRPDAEVNGTTAAGNRASTEVSASTVMVNAYWDVLTIEQFTPYVGAGIGYAHLSTSDQTTTGGVATETGATSGNLAWSLTAGASYRLMESTALDMNYRYLNLGEFGQDIITSYDALTSHELRGGLRVDF